MTLSRDAITEFKLLYQSDFGTALSDEEAEEMALRLLPIFNLWSRVYKRNRLPVIHW